jgi:origin recognition complex subunit 1
VVAYGRVSVRLIESRLRFPLLIFYSLGMVRINFQPYTTQQLEKIVYARLASAKDSLQDENATDVIVPDGVKFAAMKVSSISGDARRVLDICRRTVEEVRSSQRIAKLADVNKVVQVMQNSPTAAYLRECSLHERIMLASLLKCVRRAGIEEIPWGDVSWRGLQTSRLLKLSQVLHQHHIYSSVLTGDDDPIRRPSSDDLALVLESLVASRALLLEDGAAVARKPQEERRCMLNLEQGEVERVLGEVGGQRWKATLAH